MPHNVTKDQINALPLMEFSGEIRVINTAIEARQAAQELLLQSALGFDTETRPSFQKGQDHKVALLQLATAECAYLFRLHREPVLQEVISILESPHIIKVGVAIHDDIKALQRLHPFEARNFLDIALQFRKAGATPGLRTLAAHYLGVRISKGAKLTNWNARELSRSQQEYAAKDAVAGLLIYQQIKASS